MGGLGGLPTRARARRTPSPGSKRRAAAVRRGCRGCSGSGGYDLDCENRRAPVECGQGAGGWGPSHVRLPPQPAEKSRIVALQRSGCNGAPAEVQPDNPTPNRPAELDRRVIMPLRRSAGPPAGAPGRRVRPSTWGRPRGACSAARWGACGRARVGAAAWTLGRPRARSWGIGPRLASWWALSPRRGLSLALSWSSPCARGPPALCTRRPVCAHGPAGEALDCARCSHNDTGNGCR